MAASGGEAYQETLELKDLFEQIIENFRIIRNLEEEVIGESWAILYYFNKFSTNEFFIIGQEKKENHFEESDIRNYKERRPCPCQSRGCGRSIPQSTSSF